MKTKKIILFLSMIAVLFSLTACSDGQGKVDFQYTDQGIIQYSVILAYRLQNVDDQVRAFYEITEEEDAQPLKTGLSNFDTTAEECGRFKGYRSNKDDSVIMIDLNNLNNMTEEEYNAFFSLVDASVEENGENVNVVLKAVYEQRDVNLNFVYEKDPAYAYGGSEAPYKIKEITTAPDYTTGEKMAKAGANTLMGMGTVFLVLIFISLIIGQFEWISKLGTKTKEQDTENTDSTVVSAPAATAVSSQADDAQLVAVITAAITAASVASGGSDKLIVRSIKKVKR